jgi:acetyltransferase-like isoleucine patch superfamily enzyme
MAKDTRVETSSPPSRSVELPANDAPYRLIHDVRFGGDVVVHPFANLYGCAIGQGTRIGTFVEVQKGASIGSWCKVQSHTFICEGVTIGDEVFVGHGVIFVNDKHPRATNRAGQLQTDADWQLSPILVETGASIGSGAVILGGVTVGAAALIGAGAVVTKNVPRGGTVAGNPARLLHALGGPSLGSS